MNILNRGLIYDAAQAPPDARCAAFTSLLPLADGSLLCTFRVGPTKMSPVSNIGMMQSTDGGRTWNRHGHDFDPIFQGTPGSFSSGYPCQHAPGKLSMYLVWVDRSDPSLPLANPETTGVLPMKCLVAESSDGGHHWGELREVSLRPHRGASLTSEIIRLDDGNLLLPYESWKDWDDVTGTQSANVRLSQDEGQTWSDPVTMASDPEQKRYYWDNRLAKDPETGRLVALFWTHQPKEGLDDVIHIAWAEPDGTRWSPPRSTGIAGQIAAPLVLSPSELLCVYVHRHDPPSMRAVLSRDRGDTWQLDEELVLYESGSGKEAGTSGPRKDAAYWEDMERWTFGHPKAVRLPDGTVLLAFYGGTPDVLSIHWVQVGF